MKIRAIVAVDDHGRFMGYDKGDDAVWSVYDQDPRYLTDVHIFNNDEDADEVLKRHPAYTKKYVTITIEVEETIEKLYQDWQNKIEGARTYPLQKLASQLAHDAERRLFQKLGGQLYHLKDGTYLLPTNGGYVYILERK